MRRQLPIFDEQSLDDVGVANPCDADWASMRGDDRVRHCGACRQNVYNISAMTRREAATLIASREGRLCLRLFKRTDGTLITQDCRTRLREARKRGLVAFAVALAIVCVTQLGLRIVLFRSLLDWHQSQPPHAVATQPAPPVQPPPPLVPMMGAPPAPPLQELKGERAIPTPPPVAKKHPQPKHVEPAPHHPVMGKMIPSAAIMGDYSL